MKKRSIANLLTVFLCLILIAFVSYSKTRSAQEKRVLRYGDHMSASSGKSATANYDSMSITFKIINNESPDYQIVPQYFPTHVEVNEAFAKNKIDIAMRWPDQAQDIMDRGGDLYLLATIENKEKEKYSACLWKRKGDPRNNISDIIGSTLVRQEGIEIYYFCGLRQLLFENGIDKPLWRVFKSFVIVPNQNSAFMALAMGKADFYWTGNYNLKTNFPEVADKVEPAFCTEPIYGLRTLVVNKKTVSESDYKKLRDNVSEFITAMKSGKYDKKYPEVRMMRMAQKTSGSKVVLVDQDEFKTDFELYKKAKNNTWREEMVYIKSIMDNTPMGQVVEIEPSFTLCKKFCKGKTKKALSACVDACMK
jgi:ABC-type phosphate/phosphonate transport system substrate-binding protein